MPDLSIIGLESDVELKLSSATGMEGIVPVPIPMRPTEDFACRLGFWEWASFNRGPDCLKLEDLMTDRPADNFRNHRIKVRIAHSMFSIHLGPNLDITWNALDPVWHAKLFAPLETLALFIVQLGLE